MSNQNESMSLINIPQLKFNSLKDVTKFCDMTKTDFAIHYANTVKDCIKIIGKELDVYYYDESLKIWKCVTNEVYVSSIADYFNQMSKNLWKAFKKHSKTDDEDDDDDNDEDNKKRMNDVKKRVKQRMNDLDSSAYISTIITRSTGRLQDNKFVTKLNNVSDFLPIKNGNKVNLRNGKVTERTKSDYFSFESNVEVVKETIHADKFFRQVMPSQIEREFLRVVLGYLLTGDMDARKFFIWYGDGSNGKSAMMRMIKTILGSLYHQTSKGIFMKGSQEKVEGPSPDKVALIGVRCATYSEGESADNIDINESFLKMVSGKDEINARALFRAPLTFFPVCKLNLLTNYKPDVNGDKSMRERMIYIFLDASFVDNPDPNKPNEFKRDDELIDMLCTTYISEIFTWMLQGSIEYYKTKTIIMPESFQKRTNAFFEQQDSITSFFNNKLIITSNNKDYIKRSDLFEEYKKFSNDNSQRCHPRSTLFKRLEDLHVIIAKKDGYDVYRGIKIKSHYDNDDDDDDDDEVGVDKSDKSVNIFQEYQNQLNILRKELETFKSNTETIEVKVTKKKGFGYISAESDDDEPAKKPNKRSNTKVIVEESDDE